MGERFQPGYGSWFPERFDVGSLAAERVWDLAQTPDERDRVMTAQQLRHSGAQT